MKLSGFFAKALLLIGMLAAPQAQAALVSSLDVTLGATPTAVAGSNLAGNIDLSTTPLTGSAYGVFTLQFLPSNLQTLPSGTLFGGNYLHVFQGGSSSLTLAPGQSGFGLTWGLIDSYNTLTLKDSANNVFSFTGAQIVTLAATAGLIGVTADSGTQLDVVFTDPLAKIVSATFTRSNNGFEAANLAEVPLPPEVLLFGVGLLATGCFCCFPPGGV